MQLSIIVSDKSQLLINTLSILLELIFKYFNTQSLNSISSRLLLIKEEPDNLQLLKTTLVKNSSSKLTVDKSQLLKINLTDLFMLNYMIN